MSPLTEKEWAVYIYDDVAINMTHAEAWELAKELRMQGTAAMVITNRAALRLGKLEITEMETITL